MSEILRKLIPDHYYKQHFSEITFKTNFGNCVYLALKKREWKEYDTNQQNMAIPSNSQNQWTLQWCEKQRVNDVFEQGLSGNQKVNHFRLYTQLCRKDMLMKNVKRYKQQLIKKKELNQNQWNFLPSTYFLPSQYIMFAQEFKKFGGLWILKPTGRCQGSGIFLVDKLSQVIPYKNKTNLKQSSGTAPSSRPVNKKKIVKQEQQPSQQINPNEQTEDNQNITETFLIQKYIDKPLLFGMKKFDLRIYVLCTDYKDLTVWLYRNGFARFTHEPYNKQDINNLGSHLTNVQIQKHCDNYDVQRGGKWLLKQFKTYLFSKYTHKKIDQCFLLMEKIIINSLKAVQSKLIPSKSSFQLYGYDFMLDEDLNPWLIEVNGGPSMTANTQLDCELKCGLVDDVLSIIDLEGYLQGDEMVVGGFDLIMKKGIRIVQGKQSDNKTMLGCKNQRKKVMKKIGSRFLVRKRKEQKDANKEKQKKKLEKQKKQQKLAAGKQKLLPNFYYQRKQGQINNNIIQQLKKQMKILSSNQQSIQDDYFIPLK